MGSYLAGMRWAELLPHLLLACCLAVTISVVSASLEGESYHEEVSFKPIGKGLVLSQFVFRLSSNKSSDHVLFPWSLHQLQRAVPFMQLNLAMTKGRWDHGAWGDPPPNVATPTGLELSASFPAHLSITTAEYLWGNLTEALSGMVCASVANQVSPTLLHPKLHQAVTPLRSPTKGTPPTGSAGTASSAEAVGSAEAASAHWFHLLLPQEGVCTENLSPLLKLLPCKGVAGPAALLPIPVLHAAHFYSIQLLNTGPHPGLTPQQPQPRHLSIMINIIHAASFTPDGPGAPPGAGRLHLSSLFPVEKFPGSCVLASTSSLYITLPTQLARRQPGVTIGGAGEEEKDDNGGVGLESPSNQSGELTVSGPRLIPLAALSSDGHSLGDEGKDVESGHISAVGHAWKDVVAAGKLPDVVLLPSLVQAVGVKQGAAAWKPQMHAVITGPIHGQLMLRLSRRERQGGQGNDGTGRESEVCLVQAIPNHMRIWLHSTQLNIDGKATSLQQHLTLLHLTPAAHPSDPFGLQLCLSLPPATRTAALSWRFSKAIKHVFDHPPDAARGLDVPPVMVVTRHEVESVAAAAQRADLGVGLKPSAVLWDLLTGTSDKVYSETLVTPISTPDFSMPYNVCCLTCTLLAVFFGTTLNTMMLRNRENGRNGADKSKRSLRSRLIKMAIAVVLMLGLLYRFDEGTRESLDGVLTMIGIQIPSA